MGRVKFKTVGESTDASPPSSLKLGLSSHFSLLRQAASHSAFLHLSLSLGYFTVCSSLLFSMYLSYLVFASQIMGRKLINMAEKCKCWEEESNVRAGFAGLVWLVS